jgi:Protein of unknown function (DUF2934)
MFEKEPAKSAAAKPKGKAAAAPRAKTTVTKPGSQTAGARPAAANWREDNTHDRIQRRAYELWENEGRPAGREHAHWLQAEREVARARAYRVGVSQ